MSYLIDSVQISRRFQRSINIGADIGDPKALKGFIFSRSSETLLQHMANHVKESGQGAFTWTGPYGTGKSSLAVALAGILCGSEKERRENAGFIGSEFAKGLWEALPPKSKGWKVIPVVGRRDNPVSVLGEAISNSAYLDKKPSRWTSSKVLSYVKSIAAQHPRSSGGLILFIDEMGKFLEAAARDDHDVYLFQELAEAASRSNGRLILIGVLHQSFQEYANRLSRELRDEWSKIQGRYIDLVVDATGQEQIELISKAIESEYFPTNDEDLFGIVADHVSVNTGANSESLQDLLKNCWPIHPTVACLLGPISRRRFGQNQRSIFGFLNSAEPHAFQEFIAKAKQEDLYYPEDLWDYLRTNLEPSILASPDGHRWSMAVEALERCEGLSEDEVTINTMKCISLIDLFKERSGLRASDSLIRISVKKANSKAIKHALTFLKSNSLVVYRKFQNAYGVYAGSDFDIESQVQKTREELSDLTLTELYRVADVHPVLAKRHYHRTGALRWFDVAFTSVSKVFEEVENYEGSPGAVGKILLVIPTRGESLNDSNEICREASRLANDANVLVGQPLNGHEIGQLAVDLIALESVRKNSPELAGDSVARREVNSRLSTLQQILEEAIQSAFESSTWYLKNCQPRKQLDRSKLNQWLSKCCDHWFNQAPIIKNEMLFRRQPSNNAVAAQNQLLRLMVMRQGLPSLGIDGYPAEAGLLASLLERTGLYRKKKTAWAFLPLSKSSDPANLLPALNVALDLLKTNKSEAVSLSEIYDIWRSAPFGIADGLMPVLSVAFILSHSRSIAFYRDGLFRPEVLDLDVDHLAKDASDIQLRWMNLTGNSKKLLSGLATIIQEVNPGKKLIHLQPIDVARELVAIHDTLPGWSKRTQKLSSKSLQLRRLLNQARDPNQFLFRDLPSVLQQSSIEFENQDIDQLIITISDCVLELSNAYPNLIAKLKVLLLDELDVPNAAKGSLAELRERAKNILGIAGDFRIDAFCRRVLDFDGSNQHIEALASMAANKPSVGWGDQDVQKMTLELAAFCRAFRRAESFAHVLGRADKRHALSVVVGMEGKQSELWSEFDIKDADKKLISSLTRKIKQVFHSVDTENTNIVLATLAEITADYLKKGHKSSNKKKAGKAA